MQIVNIIQSLQKTV